MNIAITRREQNPPVAVLYYGSPLYRRNCWAAKRSHFANVEWIFLTALISCYEVYKLYK
jgi:hypothetical protein